MTTATTPLLLFDIDGTLLLSGGAGLRALNRAFEEQFGVAEGFRGIPVAGRTDPLLLRDAAARAGLALTERDRLRFHDRYCDLLDLEIQRPGPRKGLMPGVQSLIPRLHTRPGLSVALLTGNFARAARIKLAHFGLWSFFQCGAYGDDARERDGLVPVALARAEAAGIGPRSAAQAVVIGDTPLDIRCAVAGGARSIAVATGSYDEHTLREHDPDAVLPDLSNPDAFMDAVDSVLAGGTRELAVTPATNRVPPG